MAPADIPEDVLGFAARVERICTIQPDLTPVARQLLWLRLPYTANSFELPLLCTDSPSNVCVLLKRLSTINEILLALKAESLEDAPGKVAVRINRGLLGPVYADDEGNHENQAILYCLLARHRCVQRVQFLLPPSYRQGFELLLCSALTSTESVTCLHLRHFKISKEDTSVIFSAICRRLPSTLDLSKTTSLRHLAIQYRFLPCGIHAILAVVRDCDCVSEFHLHKLDLQEVQSFYNALVATGTGPKVTVGCWIACDHYMTALVIRTWSELRTGGEELFFGSVLRQHYHQPSIVDFCRALDDHGRDNLT
ncbi:hypothetical protein V5799_005789 [Amblyomma americanum]|uniref:Uncharacterized protein n=1 Tax=Amblyomma americanum TaxID=6943 RepID=A0AAQ4DY87_AMBAM